MPKQITDYKLYPQTKERLIKEIKAACNDYDKDELGDADFISLIRHYQEISEDEQLLGSYVSNSDLSRSFVVRSSTENQLGKRRSKLLEKILSTKMFYE